MRLHRPIRLGSYLSLATAIAALTTLVAMDAFAARSSSGGARSFSASRMQTAPRGVRTSAFKTRKFTGARAAKAKRTRMAHVKRPYRLSSARLQGAISGNRATRYPNNPNRLASTYPPRGATGGTTGPRNPNNPNSPSSTGTGPRDPKNPGNTGPRDPKYPGGQAGGDGGRPGTGPTRPGGDRPGRPGNDGPRGPVGGGSIGPGGFPPGAGGGGNIVISSLSSGGAAPPPPPRSGSGGPQGPRAGAINIPPQNETRFVSNEVLVEFSGNMTPQQIGAFAGRHRLTQLETLRFTLTNTIFFRARITDGRPVRTVLGSMSNDAALLGGTMLAAQPQYLYRSLQQDTAGQAPAFTPPPAATALTPAAASAGALPSAMQAAQYMLTKLRLMEAHGLSRGNNVLVAVIDSGVDTAHPEIADVIAGSYDALGIREKPHFHGTAIAGAIAAHSQLKGVAPAARILAIRAFGAVGTTAEATTMAILKSIEYAVHQNARVINMSFAGPSDPGLSRHIERARANGAVLVAAAGNFGPDSPPQFPAADPNVIAVTATDANDELFSASNRGNHIAIAAPGVDILLPEPDSGYQLRSGTSFAAAHVSGIVALILERKPSLSPDLVRQVLLATAKDLGAPGTDPLFGAGLADAYRAILALESQIVTAPPPATPTAAR